jgi:hypothetical protein
VELLAGAALEQEGEPLADHAWGSSQSWKQLAEVERRLDSSAERRESLRKRCAPG